MNIKSLCRKCACLTVALGLLALPLAALAGEVDPTGEKLQGLKDDPKFQEVMQEHGGNSAGVNYNILCAAELATFVGGIIWGERALEDHCEKYSDGYVYGYCLVYSKHCDHYHWQSKCLKEASCPDEPQ